jgi:peptidoglycan/LPS O-acetylase OafA/YrhL
LKNTFLTLLGSYGLMLLPYIGSQFSDDWDWSFADFLLGGILLFALGMLIQFLMSKLRGSKFRIPVIIGIVVVFLLIWIELAVGIFN